MHLAVPNSKAGDVTPTVSIAAEDHASKHIYYSSIYHIL